MYRLEYFSRGTVHTATYHDRWLAYAMFKCACAPPTDMARLYSPNGELVDKFEAWASEAGVAS